MRDIEVDLSGRSFRLIGDTGPVATAIDAALTVNGATRGAGGEADLLIVMHDLLPTQKPVPPDDAVLSEAGEIVNAGGRIVFVLSVLAGVPARRHAAYSVTMAAAQARMRLLAMQLAPTVLVNAVGAGCIAEAGAVISGDAAMLGHVPLGRPGRIADIVNALLFLCDPTNTYTTGQTLHVDAGWSVGYARNF